MALLSDILRSGKNLLFSDAATNRLPVAVEATLPTALGVGVANGLAKLNAQGIPITAAGVPAAVIGTVAGTAADAGDVATKMNAAQQASSAAVSTAAAATGAAQTATGAAQTAAGAANAAAAASALKIGTSADSSAVPQVRWYPTESAARAALAAGQLPAGSVALVTAV